MVFGLRPCDIPAQAEVDRKPAVHLPVVGDVKGRVPDVGGGGVDICHGQIGTVHVAQQETGIGVAGARAVGGRLGTKGKGARSAPVLGFDVIILPDFGAPLDGVAAVDPGGVTAGGRVAGRIVPERGHGAAGGGRARKADQRERLLFDAGQTELAGPLLAGRGRGVDVVEVVVPGGEVVEEVGSDGPVIAQTDHRAEDALNVIG